MSSPSRPPVHLVRTDENTVDIEALFARLGRPVGIAGVLDDLNRQATKVPVPGRAVEWGFTWNEPDQNTTRWWPQGITTSADAEASEEIDGRRLLIVTWYSKTVDGENHGSRITVIDLETLRYRHVLLMVPIREGDEVRLEPLNVHAGGIVWFDHYVHVAGTRRGIFSSLLDDIVRMAEAEETFGYRYVLPVRMSYDAFADHGTERMRYSFLSLDRGSDPPQLIAGEYARGDMTKRLVRYPLDPATYHLYAEEDGTSRPAGMEDRGLGHMQGATVVGDTYYVSVSRGRWRLGSVYVGVPGDFTRFPRSMPVGPEDISYWPSTDMLWSVTEYPHRRFVFCMKRSQFAR